MRILFLNKASLRHEGGAEIRTREVGKRLAASGHEVVVLAAKTNIHDPPFEILDGMILYHKKVLPDWIVRRFPAPAYLTLAAANFFLMFHIYFFLKKEAFDVIREDISPFPPTFLLSAMRLRCGRRIAVAHNLSRTLGGWLKFYGPVYGVAGFLMDRLLRHGLLKYDRIICAAKWLADELKQAPKIAERVAYVPNGVDLDHFSKTGQKASDARRVAQARRRRTGEVRLLSVGRLVEMKGFRYLIEALSCLKDDYPHLKILILGKGPLRDLLIEQARVLRVEHRVEICPPIPYEEMPEVYHQSDFLVLPFLTEGFPMVLLEAMASELPIVATDIPGITGILDANSATLASSANALHLADKLKWALDHPDAVAQKTELAYKKAKQYDWDLIAKQELEGVPTK